MASSRGSGSADATNASRVSLGSADGNISPNDAPALRSALEASSAAFAAQAAENGRLRSRLDDAAGLGVTVAPPAGFGRSAAKACDGAEHRRREADDATIELPPHDSADDSEAETVCSTDALTALQFLPDVLLLGVLDFNDNLSRGSLFIASKVLATRLRQARGTVIAGLNSDHLNEQIKASTQLRMLLSGINPPIQMVIDAGVVPRLVQFVREDFKYVVSPSPKLQLEAAWILAQIVSSTSDHIRVVVEEDGVPIFCSLMGSSDESTRLRAASALGLMAIESPTYRDMVLEEGMMELLLDQICEDFADDEKSIRSLRASVALLTQLCRGDPPLELYRVAPALEVFATLIRSKDEEVLSSTCQGLTYISAHGDIERTLAIIEEGVCPRLVELLGHTSREVAYDALHTLGNMISSDHGDHTEFILSLSLLPRLSKLLDHDDVKICNDAVWTIGNICAGSLGQIQVVLDFDGLVPQVINLLIHSDAGIRKEAAYVVDNVIQLKSRNQIAVLISHGCIPLLCKLLKVVDVPENGRVRDDIQETMRVALNSFKCLARVTLSTVTRSPDHVLSFAYVQNIITDEGGLERIEFLQAHANRVISELALEVSDLFATSVRADQRALWRAGA